MQNEETAGGLPFAGLLSAFFILPSAF